MPRAQFSDERLSRPMRRCPQRILRSKRAIGSLEARDRNILRHRYLDGREVNELATVYRLRWVSMSRAMSAFATGCSRRSVASCCGGRVGRARQHHGAVASQLELCSSRLLRQ
jgi:hypothetical protein